MKYLSNFLLLIFFVGFVHSQTNDLLPSDNLVVDGIPAIPAAIVEGVGRYTEFRSATFLSWHPTKREMLISTRFADVPQIHLVKFPGGARTQLTFFKDRVGSATFNPNKGDYFLFSKDIGGGEWFQNYRYDLATGDITLLTDGKSKNSLGLFSEKGDRIVYGSTRRNGKDVDFYIMNPSDPKSDRVLAQLDKGEAWSVLDWSSDDNKILAEEQISINESYLWIFDTKTGEKLLVTPKFSEEQVAYSGGKFSSDSKGIYTTTDLNSEFRRLTYIDIGTKKYTFLTDKINWDVDEFDLSLDGKYIAFITNEDGIGVLHVIDAKTNKEIKLPKLPTGLIFGIRWHKNESELGFNINSARSTTDAYSLNIKTGKLDRWTYSETGGLNVENFSIPDLVKWKSFDKMLISGFLYMPPAKFTGKRPVIINIHGGPEAQSYPSFLGRYNYYLNELGIAIIFPNIRGSSGYGKTFLKLDNGFLREDSYKDIDALLDWIKTQPNLDADRIMVIGGSYGGHMVLAISTYYPEKIKCAVNIVGISNFVTFLENTEAYRRDLRRVEYGDERDPKMREFMEKIAPLNNAHKIAKPLFVVQGKNDPRVPYTEAEQIVASVKKNNIPIWYLMANDEGHGFAKKKNADYLFYATVMFVKKFLLE